MIQLKNETLGVKVFLSLTSNNTQLLGDGAEKKEEILGLKRSQACKQHQTLGDPAENQMLVLKFFKG